MTSAYSWHGCRCPQFCLHWTFWRNDRISSCLSSHRRYRLHSSEVDIHIRNERALEIAEIDRIIIPTSKASERLEFHEHFDRFSLSGTCLIVPLRYDSAVNLKSPQSGFKTLPWSFPLDPSEIDVLIPDDSWFRAAGNVSSSKSCFCYILYSEHIG
jgi:hypothetical protein